MTPIQLAIATLRQKSAELQSLAEAMAIRADMLELQADAILAEGVESEGPITERRTAVLESDRAAPDGA